MKSLTVILLLFSLLLLWENHELRKDVSALIDLNHDKSVYIDAGCRGRYQGAEELLPGEPTQ